MPTSAIDSLIFRNMFGDSAIRQIWSDEYRTQLSCAIATASTKSVRGSRYSNLVAPAAHSPRWATRVWRSRRRSRANSALLNPTLPGARSAIGLPRQAVLSDVAPLPSRSKLTHPHSEARLIQGRFVGHYLAATPCPLRDE